MRTRLSLAAALTLIIILVSTGCSSSQVTGNMTVSTSIPMTFEVNNPPAVNSVQTITLTFSEPLAPNLVMGAIKLYRMNSNGNLTDVPCEITIDPKQSAAVNIKSKGNPQFPGGEKYKLIVSNGVKSKRGLTLEKTFIGYFRVNP